MAVIAPSPAVVTAFFASVGTTDVVTMLKTLTLTTLVIALAAVAGSS